MVGAYIPGALYGCVAQLVEAIYSEGSNPSASSMAAIMDPEDELNFLIKENKELKKLVTDLKEKISQKDTQLDAQRLKIDELQQLLFRLRDTV